ncbi:MAG: ABC-three component system protein [Acetobacterium sp.]
MDQSAYDQRNATASWNGYLHQGKVGIFLALQKIMSLMDINDQDLIKELENWCIEFESAEDIDIKKNEKVVSRHQIKAYKDGKFPNDYKDVLGVLKYEIKGGKNRIIDKGFRICEFDLNGNSCGIEVDEKSRYLHTITETLGFDLTKVKFKKEYPRSNFVDNPNKIQLFKYPNGKKHCNLSTSSDELVEYSTDEIKKILNSKEHTFKDRKDCHKNILNHIISELDQEIRKNHILGGSLYPVLKFIDIYNIIMDKTEYSKTKINFIREKFSESWSCFIEELNESYIKYELDQVEKINNIVAELYNLNDEEFIQFLKNINPDQKDFENNDEIDYIPKLCKIDNLKDVFYNCLIEVKGEEFSASYIGYEKHGGYLLTAINRRKTIVKTIINTIYTNSGIINAIFDRSYLINGQIDSISFEDILTVTVPESSIENNWGSRAIEANKFFNPKMKFISVENASKKLNEGNDK